MAIFKKLMQIQTAIDGVVKDAENTSDRYKYASSNYIIGLVRPLMNDLHLLLFPMVTNATLHEGATRSGTTRFMTEMWWTFRWVDADDGETYDVPWYSQGVDLAGEKGTGKAATYAEKYYLLKQFHIPTDKDDPDSDGRTASGEKKQAGTQAAKENALLMRDTIAGIVEAISEGDAEKAALIYKTWTAAPARGYEGAESLDAISDRALGSVYAKAKTQYKKRFGKDYEPTKDKEAEAE